MQRILRVNPRTVAQPTTWRAGLGELSPRLFDALGVNQKPYGYFN